jgi:iron(III) transport system ATP-binding protein
VTHDQEEAMSFAEQVAVMRAGRFTQVGTPEQVYAAPADLFTAQFLGDCVLLDADISSGVADCMLGRVPVQGNAPHGASIVMMRPEQLVAHAVSNGDPGSGSVRAVEFRGADVILTIALDGRAEPIQVRRISVQAPNVGTRVRLEILGAAVAFGADQTVDANVRPAGDTAHEPSTHREDAHPDPAIGIEP